MIKLRKLQSGISTVIYKRFDRSWIYQILDNSHIHVLAPESWLVFPHFYKIESALFHFHRTSISRESKFRLRWKSPQKERVEIMRDHIDCMRWNTEILAYDMLKDFLHIESIALVKLCLLMKIWETTKPQVISTNIDFLISKPKTLGKLSLYRIS